MSIKIILSPKRLNYHVVQQLTFLWNPSFHLEEHSGSGKHHLRIAEIEEPKFR
jgi:hypothetical protein